MGFKFQDIVATTYDTAQNPGVFTAGEYAKALSSPIPLPQIGRRASTVRSRTSGLGLTGPSAKRKGYSPPQRGGSPQDGTHKAGPLTEPPYLHCGKVVLTFPNGSGHGSGCFIAPGVILTAAHVVADNPTKVTFVPSVAQPNTQGAVAGYPVLTSLTSKYYNQNPGSPNFAYDVAVCLLATSFSDAGEYHGWSGWDYTPPGLPMTVRSIGYPASPPTELGFDGNTLWEAVGQPKPTSDSGLLAMSNRMTAGCSGGPWLADASDGDYGCVWSVNSHVRSFDDGVMYGPNLALELPRFWDAVVAWVAQQNAGKQPGSPDYGSWIDGSDHPSQPTPPPGGVI